MASLRAQPLVLLLRAQDPAALLPLVSELQELGLRHLEVGWQPGAAWIEGCRILAAACPQVQLGAASIVDREGVVAAAAAGLRYAMAPVLERRLLAQAAAASITLVPGVFTPTEVHRARRWGCRIVKLFPASSVGPGYWPALRAPLGDPLPFCIAAGGLQPEALEPWWAAGVGAVTLGSALLRPGTAAGACALDTGPLRALLKRWQG